MPFVIKGLEVNASPIPCVFHRMYRPLWSSAILEDLEYHEAHKLTGRGERPDAEAARARHLVERMASAFDDGLVENWEPLEGGFGLPDPDDEHVVAAAVISGAGAIVTANLKDFPTNRIPPQIRVLTPAAFAADTVAVSPTVALAAIEAMSGNDGQGRTVVGELHGEGVALLR